MNNRNTPPTGGDWTQLNAWRKSRRAHWIAWRRAQSDETRRAWDRRMNEHLDPLFPEVRDVTIGFCWPYQAEFDARHLMHRLCSRGAIAALPEVAGKGMPLLFRHWWPAAPMKRGVYDIPYPDQTRVLLPDILLVPMVACDQRGFRLGYGGGYFDRTLAQPGKRPVAVGITYDATIIESIFPQPHDIAMDVVVTETGIYAAGGRPLQLLEAASAALQLQDLLRAAGENKHKQ